MEIENSIQVNYVNIAKIKKYETLLEETEKEINELKLKNHKKYTNFKKNNKFVKLLKKISNSFNILVIILIGIPVCLNSVLAGLTICGMFGTFLIMLNYSLTEINKIINTADNCTENAQQIVSDEIEKLEIYKNTIENSLYVRSILKAILDKQYVATFELEKVSNFINDKLLIDFHGNEFIILDEYRDYYNNKKQEELTFNNYSNEITKEKVKIKK